MRNFWHIPEIFIENNSLKSIIANGINPIKHLHEKYTHDNLIKSYKEVYDRVSGFRIDDRLGLHDPIFVSATTVDDVYDEIRNKIGKPCRQLFFGPFIERVVSGNKNNINSYDLNDLKWEASRWLIINSNNNIIQSPDINFLYGGLTSVVSCNGPIVTYIHECKQNHVRSVFYAETNDEVVIFPKFVREEAELNSAKLFGCTLTMPMGDNLTDRMTKWSKKFDKENMFMYPIGDYHFVKSLYDDFSVHRVSWEAKKDILFYRGSIGGYGGEENLRIRCVTRLVGMPNTDVKFIRNSTINSLIGTRYSFEQNPVLFGDFTPMETCTQYKALMSIGGLENIATNIQWIFATGCVPVIAMGNNDFWFRKYLKHGYNCLFIKDDLSDLEDIIRYIFEDDNRAQNIAEKALDFCRDYMSPESQRKYIKESIDNILCRH
jgi:hypothetical protein